MTQLVRLSCENCGVLLRVKRELLGKRGKCPSCEMPTCFNESDTLSNSTVQTTVDNSLPERESQPARKITKFGRFEIRELLGEGAFGRVYKAFDPQLERFVALKLPIFGASDQQRIRRFIAEAKHAARLMHPGIVQVYESGQVGDKSFIATQFVEGETLASRIKLQQLAIREAVELVIQLADALSYAHQQGIIHRDIKPENIMLDEDAHPLIMDFGLAKRLDDDANMTRDGALLGTPAYMSPEQARGEIELLGPASDQYSLGVVLYRLLAGGTPFSGPMHVVIAKVATSKAPLLSDCGKSIPRELVSICDRALAHSPADRYTSCLVLKEELERWLARHVISSRISQKKGSLGIAGWIRSHSVHLAYGFVGSVLLASIIVLSQRSRLDVVDPAMVPLQLAEQNPLDEPVSAVSGEKSPDRLSATGPTATGRNADELRIPNESLNSSTTDLAPTTDLTTLANEEANSVPAEPAPASEIGTAGPENVSTLTSNNPTPSAESNISTSDSVGEGKSLSDAEPSPSRLANLRAEQDSVALPTMIAVGDTSTWKELQRQPAALTAILLKLRRDLQEITARKNGYLILGRIQVVGVSGVPACSQMIIEPHGFFADAIKDLTRPIGFRRVGCRPLDLNVQDHAVIDENGIIDVGTLTMEKAPSGEIHNATVNIALEGPARPTKVQASMLINHGPTNTPSNGIEGSNGESYRGTVPGIFAPNGRVFFRGLTQGDYTAVFSAQGFVTQMHQFAVRSDQDLDMGRVELEFPRKVSVEYVVGAGAAPQFSIASIKRGQLEGDDRWSVGSKSNEWDLQFAQKDKAIHFNYFYGPCSIIDLGEGNVIDYIHVGVDQAFKDPRVVPAISGHVYLLNQGAWNRYVLFRLEVTEPDIVTRRFGRSP